MSLIILLLMYNIIVNIKVQAIFATFLFSFQHIFRNYFYTRKSVCICVHELSKCQFFTLLRTLFALTRRNSLATNILPYH